MNPTGINARPADIGFDSIDPYGMNDRFYDGVMRATYGLSTAPRPQIRYVAPNGQPYPVDYSFPNCPAPVQQIVYYQAPAPPPVVSQQLTYVPGLGLVVVPLVTAPAPPIRYANTYGSSVTSITEVNFHGPHVASIGTIYYGP